MAERASVHQRTRHLAAHIERLFDRLNLRYWDGTLERPPIRVVPAGQAGLADRTCWGACGERAGRLEIEVREVDAWVHPCFVRAILIHEMAHLAVGPEHGHGPRWRREIRRLSERGALKETI